MYEQEKKSVIMQDCNLCGATNIAGRAEVGTRQGPLDKGGRGERRGLETANAKAL